MTQSSLTFSNFCEYLQSLLAEIEGKKEEATELVGRKKKVSSALGEKQPTVEEENIFNDQVKYFAVFHLIIAMDYRI